MKNAGLLFAALFSLSTLSCKKDKVSPQTKETLQNKWTLISSSLTFPTNTSLNSYYKGISTDYYFFREDDSLEINQAGQVNLLTMPLFVKVKYNIVSNSTINYLGGGNPVPIKIRMLSNNLLVLSNDASATFINADNSTTVYNGTKVDSLSR
ncbi:MAG: hypothetical protein C5B52_09105 [Bacteroidetes bacterium]|nr:MAG: hypothetical protein C5B52_09105 [Bacteroidota bacterium]